MRLLVLGSILAGALLGLSGCRTDQASKASSEIDQRSGAPNPSASYPSPSDKPQNDSQTLQLVQDNRPLVVCFGDSLTAGYGADDGQSYPDFLQKDLTQDDYRYRVVNAGESGNTTKDGIDRLNGVIAMKPAVVVLEFGGNDGLRGLKVETTRSNLGQMIVRLKSSGAKVLLAGISLPPDYGPDYVKDFTATYPLLAHKFNVPYIPFIYQDVYGVPGMIQADGIHATDQGNEIVARNILRDLIPLLKK